MQSDKWSIRRIAMWCALVCAVLALYGAWAEVQSRSIDYAIGLILGGILFGGTVGAAVTALRNVLRDR